MYSMNTLRVMTFNIAWCQWGLDKVAAHINAQDPDIVFLQEVDKHTPKFFRSNGEDQALELSKKTNLRYYQFGKTWTYRGLFGWHWGGEVGNAFLSKRPLGTAKVHPVPGVETTFLES